MNAPIASPVSHEHVAGVADAVPTHALQVSVDPSLPEEIRVRVPLALARAAAKTKEAARPSDTAAGFLQAAQRARTARQRVIWLQRWGAAQVQPLASVAACRRGCDHCCHIAVHITSIEAELIGGATGRAIDKPTLGLRIDKTLADDESTVERWQAAERKVAGQPCPFLVDHQCSIYEHRPFACRTHLSLDDDDLLCRLGEGADIPMPRLDVRLLVGYFLSAQPGAVIADIRDFFGSRAASDGPAGEGARA